MLAGSAEDDVVSRALLTTRWPRPAAPPQLPRGPRLRPSRAPREEPQPIGGEGRFSAKSWPTVTPWRRPRRVA